MDSSLIDLHLTPNDLAVILDFTPQGIHKMIRENSIPTKSSGSKKHKIYPASVRALLEARGIVLDKACIVIHSVKGGVGKTIICHALAARAACYGYRTLVIDLDKQGNLSDTFGIDLDPEDELSLMDAYDDYKRCRRSNIDKYRISIHQFLDIIPANLKLVNFDIALQQDAPNISELLSNLLEPIRNEYDLIFIDLPPDFNRVTIAAHSLATHSVIPVMMEQKSVKGLKMTYQHLDFIMQEYRKSPKRMIVVNSLDARHNLAFEIMRELAENYANELCPCTIPVSKMIDNILANSQCLWSEKMSRVPALEGFDMLLRNILNIDEWKKTARLKPMGISQSKLGEVHV